MRRSRRLPAIACGLALLARTGAGATTAAVSPQGHLVVDGQPFFPIGIYHVSWIGDRQGEKTVPAIRAMADAGFNLVHPTIDARPDMIAMLDQAELGGLRVIGEIPWPVDGPDGFINLWKNHPAMIGWLVRDDFNAPYYGPPAHPAGEVLARHQEAKSLDPDHLTYASGGSFPGFRIAEYAGTVDVMGMQSYPVSALNNPFADELEENGESFDWVRDQLAGTGQVFLANPQAFRWQGGRWPTAREARNLLYPPLQRGAKGVLWYTYWDGHGELPDANPELWEELRREVAELKSLTPFLLHAVRTELATAEPRLRAARFDLDGQVVFVLVNTDRTATYPVALPVPANTMPVVHRMFPGRSEAGLTIASGELTGAVGPEEVHVVLLDTTMPGNQSPNASVTPSPALVAYDEPLVLDASSSSDPDGTIASWSWDFGDGTFASGATATHSWSRLGTHHVRLTVRDDDQAPATAFVPVEVAVTSLCPATPRPGCRAAGRASVVMNRGTDPRRSLRWRWKRATVALPDLGDPRTTTEVALCLYAGGTLTLATGARPDPTRWQSLGAAGFTLRGTASRPGGISSARLRTGTNGTLSLNASGAQLPSFVHPLALPVITQLITSDTPTCFEATFPTATTNTTSQFRAH